MQAQDIARGRGTYSRAKYLVKVAPRDPIRRKVQRLEKEYETAGPIRRARIRKEVGAIERKSHRR